jgi:hypothetical protein
MLTQGLQTLDFQEEETIARLSFILSSLIPGQRMLSIRVS